MSDCFKCSLISLGIGMAAGVYVATNNKKLQKFVKDTENMIEEKLCDAKNGINKLKEEYIKDEDAFEEEGKAFMEEMTKTNSKKSNKSKK